DGTRAIRAVAVDAALNTGEDVRTITIDRTPPTGVTVSYPNGYVSGSFAVTTNNGSDSDVDASSGALERQTGDLINDTCSSYGGWRPAAVRGRRSPPTPRRHTPSPSTRPALRTASTTSAASQPTWPGTRNPRP